MKKTVIKLDSVKDSGDNTIISSNGSGTFTYSAASGVNMTSLNATQLTSGTIPTARLGSGTASSSTFLRGDGTWTAAGGQALTFLQKQTASNSAAITFSSTYITDTYPIYKVFINGAYGTAADSSVQVHLSTDNGSSYLDTYDQYQTCFNSGMGYNTTNAAGSEFRAKNNAVYPLRMIGGLANNIGNGPTDGETGVGEVTFFNLRDSTMYPIIGFQCGMWDSNPYIAASDGWGGTRTTTDINNIKFFQNTGNISVGTFTLCGVKDS